MTSVKNNTPNNNYGRVYLQIITNTKLIPIARLVYIILAIKQGCTDEAHLTQRQIADSLSVSINTIKRAFDKLKETGIIETTVKGWKVNQPEINNHYGKVELIVIGATFLSNHAKLLYAYYIVDTSGVDKCTRCAKTITKDLGISEDSYRKAFKELEENTLITVGKRNTRNGYINVVAPRRLTKANPKDFLPASWFREDEIELDTTAVNPYNIVAMINNNGKVSKQKDDGIISGGLMVSNQKVRELQSKGININLNTNHNINPNREPDLIDSTYFSLSTKDKKNENPQEYSPTINLKIFAPDFNVEELNELDVTENEFKIVIRAFTGLRKVLNRPEWRMSNKDYARFDNIFKETGYREEIAIEYVNFIEVHVKHEAPNLSYYNSEPIMYRFFSYVSHFSIELLETEKTVKYDNQIKDIKTQSPSGIL